MAITSQQVNELRQRTGLGMMDCKKALEESGGDADKAIDILRKKGIAKAGEKATRTTAKGLVVSYIHSNNTVGTLVEINCETDFVARTDNFQNFCKDVAMHVAAANPLYLSPEDVPAELVEKEAEIYSEQMKNENKPEEIVKKIVAAKLDKFRNEVSLLTQQYVKNPDITINDYVKEMIGKTGENVQIRRFTRFSLNG
ncbi:MAG: translation elongation factor Ts [Candidatus Abawacabacteria bacterium]|nr:translation elongation factor Ts [Candidatus Abawacabacteria bacterium]